MPKPHTFPRLFDEVKTINIAFLKQHGYLQPEQIKSGTITWSRNGVKTSSIGIEVNTFENFIELDYKANEVPVNYRIQLVKRTANIGNGVLWFFECQNTLKLCRKLYYSNPYFLHREGCKGAMYESQTYSKRTREMIKILTEFHGSDEGYETIRQKHFKRHYQGIPTKRYTKARQQIERGERHSLQDYQALFLV
jgi:hypothetical protein